MTLVPVHSRGVPDVLVNLHEPVRVNGFKHCNPPRTAQAVDICYLNFLAPISTSEYFATFAIKPSVGRTRLNAERQAGADEGDSALVAMVPGRGVAPARARH